MNELEDRVRDGLHMRADNVTPAPMSGRALRGAADARRAARRRAAAVVGVATTVAVVVAGSALLGGRTESEAPPTSRTTTPAPTTTRADGSPLQVPVADDVVASVSNELALGGFRLVATAELPGTHRTALLFTRPQPPASPERVVAATVTLDGTSVVAGTMGGIGDGQPVALPVQDGDATVLMIFVPPYWGGGTVEVTVGRPGQASVVVSRPVIGRIALVPVPAPDVLTGLSILNKQDGSTSWEGIPGGSMLRVGVPLRLDRIAVSTGESPQSVQVRTDGDTACRVTANGFFGAEALVMDWNLFDVSCAPVDGGLRLLLAADRRYSSVAGIAPPRTSTVRLHWLDGSESEVAVTDPTVRAFVDTSQGHPDRLVRAEALDRSGEVIATVRPGPTFP